MIRHNNKPPMWPPNLIDFYSLKDLDELWASVPPIAAPKVLIIETTANGISNPWREITKQALEETEAT